MDDSFLEWLRKLLLRIALTKGEHEIELSHVPDEPIINTK